MTEQIDYSLTKEFHYFASSAIFLYYGVPSNYWYPEETTFREIMKDKCETGILGLKKLSKVINAIYTDDEVIKLYINRLNFVIDSTKQSLIEGKRTLENAERLYGSILSGYFDLAMMMSSQKDIKDADSKASKLPKGVLTAFDTLLNSLKEYSFQNIPTKLNKFESQIISNYNLNINQNQELREFFKRLIRSKINQYYNSSDTLCRNEMISKLIDIYDQNYPIISH